MVAALDLVPDGASRVLDAGCALGNAGRILKNRRPVEVVGIEMMAEAAEVARTHLDDVVCADLDLRPELPYPADYFDAILFLDILEHVVLPEQVVQHLLRWLSPGGVAVFSIPNVFHVSVLKEMFGGARRFGGTGITVPEHLRFFMITDIVNLMDRLNLKIDETILALVTEPNEAEGPVGDLAEWFGSSRERAAFESRVSNYVLVASPVLDGDAVRNTGQQFNFEGRYQMFHSAEELGLSAGGLGD
jgi:SAM-dependent methyltransferase